MKVISVWSPKGGVGKSTVASNLASCYANSGQKVIVCDTDEQQSLYKLYTKGVVPWGAISGLPKEKPDADVVIIDHAPGHTKSPDGSFVLVPLRPSKIDFDSYEQSVRLLMGKSYIPIINAVDFRNIEEKTFALNMEKQGAFIIRRRSIYPRAYGLDGTVFEAERKYGASAARQEIRRLQELFK